MRNAPLGWLIAGAVMGVIGFAYNLMAVGAIINGVDVRHTWVTLGVILCPWIVPLRNMWCILALNCILYAMLFGGLRFAWIKLRPRKISN